VESVTDNMEISPPLHRNGEDVGPAGRDYRAAHDIAADSRAAQRDGGWGLPDDEALRARFVDDGTVYDPMPDDWPD
jgi:hypothetical protein